MRNKETKWKNSGKFKGDGSCEFTRPPRIPGGRVVPVPPGGSLRRRETDPATGKPTPPSPVSEQCSRPLTLLRSARVLLAMWSSVFSRITHF